MYLGFVITKNQALQKHDLFLSFWGYPSGTIAVALAKLFHRPSLVILMGGETANLPKINYGGMRKPLTKALVIWTCKKATRLVALSKYQIENRELTGLKENTAIIPQGADANLFIDAEKEISTELRIIHVANLTPVKDQHTLLKGFRLICETIPARLRIVGPDFMQGSLQKFAGELGISSKVDFVGALPYLKVYDQLVWADCFILTSLSEGQNNSILEAMMCGVLPVSTRVGLMADLGEEFGIVVAIGDSNSLAQEVISLYKNPNEWKQRTNKAKAWARAHDLNWTVNQLDQEIKKCLHSKRNQSV